jgi:hypothetical protein
MTKRILSVNVQDKGGLLFAFNSSTFWNVESFRTHSLSIASNLPCPRKGRRSAHHMKRKSNAPFGMFLKFHNLSQVTPVLVHSRKHKFGAETLHCHNTSVYVRKRERD